MRLTSKYFKGMNIDKAKKLIDSKYKSDDKCWRVENDWVDFPTLTFHYKTIVTKGYERKVVCLYVDKLTDKIDSVETFLD